MNKGFVLSLDQSTQGTKAFVLDTEGKIISQASLPHKQIYDKDGNLFHDLSEIYENIIQVSRQAIAKAKINCSELLGLSLDNQRETSCLYDKLGHPLNKAVVWKNAIGKAYVDKLASHKDEVYQKTGLPLSALFPAAKYRWLIDNTEGAREKLLNGQAFLGTVDSYLICRLNGGKVNLTDVTNASRTQLVNLETLDYDEELLKLFSLNREYLADIKASDGDFGQTDLEGTLPHPIPILASLGDSHSSFYAHNCVITGQGKVTYGTGSSIMVNIGSKPIRSKYGLATSVGYKVIDKTVYVLEGNINCTGGVITWMKDKLGLIKSPQESEEDAKEADKNSHVVLVPAFNGLNAPYNDNSAKAVFYGLKENTGKNELVKAGLESIAFQINDVIKACEQDLGKKITDIEADGGPTHNSFLMQFQADLGNLTVRVPSESEMTGLGSGLMALKKLGCQIDENKDFKEYIPKEEEEKRREKLQDWSQAVQAARTK